MTVKIVKGLVGTAAPTNITEIKKFTGAESAQHTSKLMAGNAAANEAAVSSVRPGSSTQGTEKTRDSKEARNLAKSVSERLGQAGFLAAAAHEGLSSTSARATL